MFNFKQLENLERILLLKAGVVPVDVHLHLDLHHEVHNKVQHCSVFSCTFNVQNIWFGRGSQSSRPIRDQITFHQWGERITIRCPDPLSELQISRGYSCSPFGKLLKWNFMKHLLAFENIEKKFLAHLRNFPTISRCHRTNSNVDVLPQATSFLTRRIIQGSSLTIWVSYAMIKWWNGNWLNIYFQ